PAAWIIHTVGPVWSDGKQGEPELLGACYENSFKLAVDKGCRSIAFPAISTGVYGYPKREAAELALGVMKAWQARFEEIIACCYSDADAEIYRLLCPECGGGQ
ncbi:MAG: O-acetyl-ADP-ribose deacetylase, partial [gamma proteobacterium symbiont of Ctena orbiculata]